MSDDKQTYHLIGCRAIWRELYACASASPHRVEVSLLPQGLHNTPDRLREQLQTAVDGVGEEWDAILFGYGLCCNGIVGVSHPSKPLVVPRGHDCITLLLGSKEAYKRYFDEHQGTYFYSVGWLEETSMPGPVRDEQTRQEYVKQYGEENADYLMEETQRWRANYSYATFVDWGLPGTEPYAKETEECAEYLGWRYDYVKGDRGLLSRLVSGEWNEKDFLVVPPGQTAVPSYDEAVIQSADEAPEEGPSPQPGANW